MSQSADDLYRQFIQNSSDVTGKAWHVKINNKKLDEFAAALKTPKGGMPPWNEYLSEGAVKTTPPNLTQVFHEMAVITAQNAGYLYKDEQSRTAKWERDNSGAKALLALFDDLRSKDVFRKGPKAYGPKQQIEIMEAIKYLPLANTRMEIFNETCRFGWSKDISDILTASVSGEKLVFDMQTVEMLAEKFPKAYGDDPLRKKAILLCLMMAGHLKSRGIDVELGQLPVASDYRIPETLNAAGVIEFSDDLLDRLNRRELMGEDDPVVMEIRCAAIEAVDKICQKAGLSVDQVDLALWMASRDGTLDALKQANTNVKVAKHHLACRTMWF